MMGGPQQLYHLDAYIPLQINSEESKAAFHRKRKVPGDMGEVCRELGHSGGPELFVLNTYSVFSCLSSATDGGDAPSVSGFLIGFLLSVLPSGGRGWWGASLKLK